MPSPASSAPSRHSDRGLEGADRHDGRPFTADARLTVFGHEATPARVELVPRSRRWRMARVARVLAGGLLLAPVVALVPPHAPWALGAVVGAFFLARRRWSERYTLQALEAKCPRCRSEIRLREAARLRPRHPVSCESCHHEMSLAISGVGREAGTPD